MSRLEAAIASGRFVLTAELLTVNSGGIAAVQRASRAVRGIRRRRQRDRQHCCPCARLAARGRDRAAAARHGAVMQLVCRDRNRLALEAEIAGAALHGIENICCLTGDDVTAGDEPEARRVFDLDSIQLLATANAMRNGTYLSGRKIDPPPRLFLGAVENPQAPPQRLPRRARREEGARGRAVPAAAGRLRARAARALHGRGGRERARGATSRSCRRSASCASAKSLRYIDEHVPGISVPAALIERSRAPPIPRRSASRSAASSPTRRAASRACAGCT